MGEKLPALLKKQGQTKGLIGHTRWPTKGDNELKNVHPHIHKNIIGVHNGTMFNIMGKSVPKGESDSVELIRAISEHGIDDALLQSWGAYCLVYVNTADNTLNFIRNKDRPLWFGYRKYDTTHLGTLYWASEPDFLDLVLSRKFHGEWKFEELPADTLLSYDLNTKHGIKIKEARKIERPFVVHRHGGGTGTVTDKISNTEGRPYGHRGHLPSLTKNFKEILESLDDKSSVPFTINKKDTIGTFQTAKGHYVSEDVFDRLLAEGCAWCSSQAFLNDFVSGKARWVNNSQYLCEDCLTNPDIAPYAEMYDFKGMN